MVIQAAAEQDLSSVRQLLEAQHLPADGVDEHVATMVVAKDGATLLVPRRWNCTRTARSFDRLSSILRSRVGGSAIG
jgi:hypothetical protein